MSFPPKIYTVLDHPSLLASNGAGASFQGPVYVIHHPFPPHQPHTFLSANHPHPFLNAAPVPAFYSQDLHHLVAPPTSSLAGGEQGTARAKHYAPGKTFAAPYNDTSPSHLDPRRVLQCSPETFVIIADPQYLPVPSLVSRPQHVYASAAFQSVLPPPVLEGAFLPKVPHGYSTEHFHSVPPGSVLEGTTAFFPRAQHAYAASTFPSILGTRELGGVSSFAHAPQHVYALANLPTAAVPGLEREPVGLGVRYVVVDQRVDQRRPVAVKQEKIVPSKMIVPREHDVLCGKGVNTTVHNRHFTEMCMSRSKEYCKTTKRGMAGKKGIAMDIVRHVKDNKGRFLTPVAGGSAWAEITDEMAVNKIGHCMRDLVRRGKI